MIKCYGPTVLLKGGNTDEEKMNWVLDDEGKAILCVGLDVCVCVREGKPFKIPLFFP